MVPPIGDHVNDQKNINQKIVVPNIPLKKQHSLDFLNEIVKQIYIETNNTLPS